MNNKGVLVVVSAPSGCGKDTIIAEVLKKTDDAFVSTTTKQSVANIFSHDGYIMTILIPKGSNAASVKKLSKNGPENEVLIDKKARFEVKSLNHESKEMIVELLPHEDD